MNSNLILPNKETKLYHFIVGVILNVIFPFVQFTICYGALFDRENYYNRKALYKWLKDNKLPEYQQAGKYYTWYINDYLFVINNKDTWYLFKDEEPMIVSFRGGIIDTWRYLWIKRKLIEAITNE